MKADMLTVIFWLSVAVIVLWALGKMFGLIQSPTIIEYLPYLAIGVSIGTAFQKFMNILNELKTNMKGVKDDFNEINNDFKSVNTKLIQIETRCDERHSVFRS